MDKIFAKTNPCETLEEHTQNLLSNYESLKESGYLNSQKIELYDEVIKKILSYHDLGKLNYKFQKKLKIQAINDISELKNIDEIPHEWLSLAFISKEDKKFFKSLNLENILFFQLVQYVIAFHHSRNKTKQFDRDDFLKFLKYDLEKNKSKINIDYPLNDMVNVNDTKDKIMKHFEDYFELLVFLKGILHKCDYSASAHIKPEQKYIGDYSKDFEDWLQIKNFKLRDYQNKAKDLSSKSVILIASTGAGKTEYSMNWINGKKTFYLLGIRTAVNEMYKRFKTIFNKPEIENVALLHGETNYHLLEELDNNYDYNYFQKLSEIRQLSYPITIATADQIIPSVSKYNSFESTYLTCSYSNIVLDEIQSFSPDSIALIVVFLKEIHKLGGRFLLMTATLPPFIKEEFKKLDVHISEPILTDMKRHKIKLLDYEIDSQEIIEKIKDELSKDKKVLVISNTVKNAQNLFKLLQDEDLEPNLLHSKFTHFDRKVKENEIMKINSSNQKSLWISTQIVEASLDIDFDVLFTEFATIDSLFQRFGRCYRNREYSHLEPNVFILNNSKVSERIYDCEILQRTKEILANYDEKLLLEQDKQDIINSVYENSFIKDTKYFKKYSNNKQILELGFIADNRSEAHNMFRNIINNYTFIPRPIYDNNKDEILELLSIIDNNNISFKDRMNAKKEFNNYCISAQITFNNKELLINELNNYSEYCKKHNIKLLKGCEYDNKIGLTFISDYKDYEDYIL